MEDEYLKELDSILKLSLEQASTFSKSSIPHIDNRFTLAHNFKINLEGYDAEISKLLYKIDLAQNGLGNEGLQQQYIQSFRTPQLPEPKEEDYVKKIHGGYQVYNGHQWLQVSNEANINVILVSKGDITNDFKPAVRIEVNDVKTNTHFVFEDTDLTTTGNEFLFSGQLSPNDDLAGGLPSREIYWEDPMYNNMKMGTATGGLVAGALELRQVGNLTPWRTGKSLKDAKGWYKKAGGGYNPLSAQKGLGAGGHQRGAQGALKRAKVFKNVGKGFFVLSVGFSGYEAFEVLYYKDSNKNRVLTKVSIDIVMAGVGALGGPVGWVISGTYFIADAFGAFDRFNVAPSGVRSDGVPYNNNIFDGGMPGFLPAMPPTFYGMDSPYESEFEIEYIPCSEQIYFEQQLENQIKIDNTYVAPKILFKTNKF